MKVLKAIDDDIHRQIHRNLREFGYASLTLAEVEEGVKAYLDGKSSGNIIAMMAGNMLEENGFVEL